MGMSGRALIFATVILLVAGFAANLAQAQNLEAGKSPSQIFAGTCTACHKSPRGLLKSVNASALPGFLRQHYTTSSDMASVLASYLVSNGAGDARHQGREQARRGKDARQQEAAQPASPAEPERPSRRSLFPRGASEPTPDAQQAAKPDADGLNPQGEGRRQKRKRSPQPSAAAPDAANPEQSAEPKPGAKQRLGKPSEPVGEETPKDDAAKVDTGKGQIDTPSVSSRPAPEAKPEAATADVPKQGGSGEPASPPAAAPAPSAPEPSASPSPAPAARQ
jgi:hypothetical protein